MSSNKIISYIVVIAGIVLFVSIGYLLVFNRISLDRFLNIWGNRKKQEKSLSEKINKKSFKEEKEEKGTTRDIKRIVVHPLGNKEAGQPKEEKNKFGKKDLMRMASSFAERFGSYSNQSNFSNIVDLKMFMSSHMKEWADSYIAKQTQFDSSPEIYYGITTKAIGEELKQYDDDIGQAAILVKTRRREATGSPANASKVFSQDVLISFIKEGRAWKVDSANWKED